MAFNTLVVIMVKERGIKMGAPARIYAPADALAKAIKPTSSPNTKKKGNNKQAIKKVTRIPRRTFSYNRFVFFQCKLHRE